MLRRLGPLAFLLAACLDPDGDTTSTSTSTGPGTSTGESSSSSSSDASEPSNSSTGDGSDSAAMTGSTAASTSTSSTSSTTSTTDPGTTARDTGDPPTCGDGQVNTPDEECDDGNDDSDDGCDSACARDRLVFATSEKFSPDWISGLDSADDLCKQLANKAGLDNPFSFTAWLSDSTTDAIDRIYPGKGRYLRPDGIPVAHGAQQFTAGLLLAPIQSDEYGEPLAAQAVWTGTRPDGTRVPSADHCGDWTSNNLFEKGHIGDISATNGRWTFISDPEVNPTPCSLDLHLYCIEGK